MSETTAVVNWEDRLAQFAVEAAKSEAPPAGTFITTRGGVLQVQGKPVAGNKLDVVVIDAIYENNFYEDDFDPDAPASPVCFAFSHDKDELKPHPESSKPQHDTCKGCPQNEFGTAARGKGKACKNIRRLALLPASPLTAETAETDEVAFMKLPVTSCGAFAQYVTTLSAIKKRPPFAVITTIGAQPDPKSQYKITFAAGPNITDGEILNALANRHEGQKATPTPAYQPSAPATEAPKSKSKGKF